MIRLVALCLFLAGCVYPVNKLIQPAGTVRVTDTTDMPISGAAVHVLFDINPHLGNAMAVAQTTGPDGEVQIQEHRTQQTEMLMIHGGLAYAWGVCVSHPGYQTVTERPIGKASLDRIVVLTPLIQDETAPRCGANLRKVKDLKVQLPGIALVDPVEIAQLRKLQ